MFGNSIDGAGALNEALYPDRKDWGIRFGIFLVIVLVATSSIVATTSTHPIIGSFYGWIAMAVLSVSIGVVSGVYLERWGRKKQAEKHAEIRKSLQDEKDRQLKEFMKEKGK
ncbi:MAG: hypothetical protein ABJ246_14885 [Paracoccaceae bacterium]